MDRFNASTLGVGFYAASYQWQQNKTDKRKTEVMQKKTKSLEFFFLVIFTPFLKFFFFKHDFSFLVFPFTLGGSCKMLENDKKRLFPMLCCLEFVVTRTTVVSVSQMLPSSLRLSVR